MASGGKRAGAGRPKGISKNRPKLNAETHMLNSAVLAEQEIGGQALTLEQIKLMSPLDVLRHAMLLSAIRAEWGNAASYAKELAPYQFAKLTSTKVEATVRRSIEDFSDDELIALAGELEEDDRGEGEGGDNGPAEGQGELAIVHDLHEA